MSLHNKRNLLKYIGFATGLVGVFVGAFFITEAFLRLPETGQGGFDSPIRPVNMGLGEGENKTEGKGCADRTDSGRFFNICSPEASGTGNFRKTETEVFLSF